MSGSTSILDSLTPVVPAQLTAMPQSAANSSGTSILDSLQPVAIAPQQTAQQPQRPEGYGELAQDLWGGVKRGVVGMANAPLTLLNAEGDLIKGTINAGAGKQVVPEGQIAGLPQPEAREPTSFMGRVFQNIGAMLPSVPLAGVTGGGSVVGNMARQVVPTVAGAVAGQAAEEAAPESLKPVAQLAGNLAGAGVGSAAQEGVAATGRMIGLQAGMMGIGGKEAVGGVKATPAQVQAAGQQVTQALGPKGVERVQIGPEQLVPGSQPTTAQVAMTPGAATLEKAHRTATPDPFLQRAQEQNAARLGAVQSLAPEAAQPAAVGQLFRQQLDALDQQGQRAIQGARTGVQQATDALGGAQPTAAYGDQARTALQAARAPVKAQTQALWQAVDPDGTWALPAPALRDTAARLIGEISPTAQTDAQETALLQRASQIPDVVRFQDIRGMRADINAAMQRLSGAPGYEPNVRRLTLLKQSVDQSIEDALNGRVAQEAQAVAAGQMSPDQTLAANLQRSQQDWYAARNAAAQDGGGGNVGPSSVANAPPGYPPVHNLAGAGGQANGKLGNAAGNSGVQGQAQSALEPNLTPEHADAYSAAVSATRAEKERFGQGGVGQVLRPGKQGAEFAVEPGNVPGKIFTRGPTEPQEVQRFIAAVGGPERAVQIGRETLANELRQSGIIRQDGTVDANRFATWQARRQPTIQQFPGLGDQFANAETAQRTLDDVTAAHKAAVDEFQKSAAARFINDDPSKAVAAAFGSSNPTQTFQRLVQQVRGNPDAEAGLKRAVVDFLVEKTRSATPGAGEQDMMKPAVFRNWIRQNSGPLKALFGGQGVQNLDMVAADIRRTAQASTATAGSDTAANIAASRKHGLAGKTAHGFGLTALALIGEHLGEMVHGGMLGSLGGAVALPLAGEMLHAMRQSGIATVNDLVREAMLHPSVARELVAKVQGQRLGPVALQRIARALQATVAANVMQQQSKQ